MDQSNVLFAFADAVCGLATGVGSILALLTKTSRRFLSASLGFSAGVMLYVSFAEILIKAQDTLTATLGEKPGVWATVGGFFGGILLIALIDNLIPETENPHEVHTVEEIDGKSEEHKSKLMRMGVFTALAIAIHNFPEGLATFAAALSDPALASGGGGHCHPQHPRGHCGGRPCVLCHRQPQKGLYPVLPVRPV